MIQAESLLNGRPLTHVSVDPRDPEPLTPNHFLLLQGSPNSEDDVIGEEELYSRKHWEAIVKDPSTARRWRNVLYRLLPLFLVLYFSIQFLLFYLTLYVPRTQRQYFM